MAKVQAVVVEEEAVENGHAPMDRMVDAAHKVFLAGVGAVALAQDETGELFGRLVERGETVEKEGREALKKARERRVEKVDEAEEELDRRVEKLLRRMNMPTQSDIKKLDEKISALTKKVDELKKA